MDYKKFKLSILSLALTSIFSGTFAATPVDINHKGVAYLNSFVEKPGFTNNKTIIKEYKRHIDFNHTMHMRAQETYAGFPVWGSHITVHIPNGDAKSSGFSAFNQANKEKITMDGTLYQDLEKDLKGSPAYIFNAAQAEKALKQAIDFYQHEIGTSFVSESNTKQLIVYVDDQHKAHFAYYVSLYGKLEGVPTIPVYIFDAVSFKIYKHWNDIKQSGLSKVKGGGYGGNIKIGKVFYDGDTNLGHLPALDMQRNNKEKICYLQNKDAVILNFKNRQIAQFKCIKPSANHNNIYWNADFDFVNGGFSPSNDALYAAKVIQDLYQTWYQIPVLTEYEAPMQIVMVMHTSEPKRFGFPEQAIWDSIHQIMFFGDGQNIFYPLTSIDVTAHEISHGFTSQHSNLSGEDSQSGGLNESFSDMAAQAAQYFLHGEADWKIGAAITKKDGFAFRYLDHPTKDCYGREPGENCSIETMTQYNNYLKKHEDDVVVDFEHMRVIDKRQPEAHASAGVFNRVFYLLANSKNWDIRKAFNVMVQANRYYWVENTTFEQAACGVVKATNDYKYDLATVTNAFAKIDIDTSKC